MNLKRLPAFAMVLACYGLFGVTEAEAQHGGPSSAFLLTPEAHAQVRQQSMLAAQVLSNLSRRLSHPAYSRTVNSRNARGKSNADFGYEYSYKVRVTATRDHAVMEFVFDNPQVGYPTPSPVRLTIDEFGNVLASPLSPEDAEKFRMETAAPNQQW